MLETFGWFLVGAGIGFILTSCCILFARWMDQRKLSKFTDTIKYLDSLKEAMEEKNKEISELFFRDKDGVMNTVRIIIDHEIDTSLTEEDREKVISVLSGNPDPDTHAGTIQDILAGHKIEESAMANVHEFVFSTKAVRDMRLHGVEPDEVVTRMLKASGRMPE